MLGYFITVPEVHETFTEFYVLGQQGIATDYPKELKVGEEGRVIVGIVNHEQREVSYQIEIIIDGEKSYAIGPIILVNEKKWEDDKSDPYLEPIYLWIDVSD
jgi:uncharacterized membrane protein